MATSEISALVGRGIGYHRFEHLRCSDNALAEQTAFSDYIFLKCGELGEGDFNAEIAAAYHYSVALFADFLYVIYAGAVLYFGDYVYAVAAVLAEKCLEINEILSA